MSEHTVTSEAIAAYADAVGAPFAGAETPPLYAFVAAWDALLDTVRAALPDEALTRVVHLSQDVVLHRPIHAGDTLRSEARVAAVVPGRAGTAVEVHATNHASHLRTTLFIGGVQLPAMGEPTPLPAVERGEPIATVESKVEADQAERYARASGDHNPIHVDEQAALGAGLPGVVLHGMCTLAMACTAITDAPVRRVAGRFSKPVRQGQVLRTTYWGDAPLLGFRTETEDGIAIKHGLVELLQR